MASGKTWNRRLAVAGGAALAAGGYWALREPAAPRLSLPDSKTLRRGNSAEPQTLDPALSTGTQDDRILGDLTVGLVTENAMVKPVAGMATAWTTSLDGMTWRFKLREAQCDQAARIKQFT
jgi:oligopeptide transport system substrate-binding protein